MINSAFRTFATVCFVAAISLSAPASAGHGNSLGAGLLGFGIGAVVGSALTPQTVYVAPPPPPPPPGYYGPAPIDRRLGVPPGTAIAATFMAPTSTHTRATSRGKTAAGTSASSFVRAQLAERTPHTEQCGARASPHAG